MAKKKPVPVNPASASVPLEVAGKTYSLSFTYEALALAERGLKRAGHEVNLLTALDFRTMGADRLPHVLYAALVPQQPEITPEEARALITMRTYPVIFERLVEAYMAAMADPVEDEARPTGAGE